MEQGIFLGNVDAEKSPNISAIMKDLMSRISGSGLSKEKEDIIIQKLKTLKKHQHSLLKNKFLYETVNEYCASNNSEKPLLEKAGTIIAMETLPPHINIQKPPPLTPQEVKEMRYIADERILVRTASIRRHMYESGKQDDEEDYYWLPQSDGEKMVTKAKDILSDSLKAYNKTAHLYLERALTLWDTYDKMYEASLVHYDWLEKKCTLLHLKLRILECKISLSFYSEEPQQVAALQLLEDILKEELSELKIELGNLQAVTIKYNMLKGTEYDAILQQYIGVLTKLKEQAWTLNEMSNR